MLLIFEVMPFVDRLEDSFWLVCRILTLHCGNDLVPLSLSPHKLCLPSNGTLVTISKPTLLSMRTGLSGPVEHNTKK